MNTHTICNYSTDGNSYTSKQCIELCTHGTLKSSIQTCTIQFRYHKRNWTSAAASFYSTGLLQCLRNPSIHVLINGVTCHSITCVHNAHYNYRI